MPKKYHTAAVRLAALKEGVTLVTRKAARGARQKGAWGRKRRLDEETVYRGGVMAKGDTKTVLVPVEVPVNAEAALALEPTPLERATNYAKALILSGLEPRIAITRAAGSYKVAARDLVVLLGGIPGTNVPSGYVGDRRR